MNIPVQILQHLKCSNCEDLLSCGPVLLKQDGSNICGRCSNLEEKSAVPNKPYNELAEMCMFPCKYEAEGCYEKISFSSMQQHEAGCEFRTYICPVMPSGSCEWIGSRSAIQEHIRESHPEKILEHPCEMKHDVKTASLKTFLTTAFDVVFLVYVKVSLTTHSIYHSVRRIGNSNDGRVFKYEIFIGNESGTLTKNGEVAPQGCLAMQEHTSVAVKINTVMEALDGFKNAKFVITIQDCIKCTRCEVLKNADQIGVIDKISNIFYCKSCASSLYVCKSADKGCLWRATEDYINHSVFCNFTDWCAKCNTIINEFSMLHHMRTKNHTNYGIKHLSKKYWYIHKDKNQENLTILTKDMCYLFIYAKKESSINRFFIQGEPNSGNKTKCIVILRHPTTKHTSYYIMNEAYSFKYGQFIWELELHDDKLQPFVHSNKFEVGIDIYFNE